MWLAVNPDDGVAYVYSVYKKAIAEPPIHIVAINARGTWIPGAIDPASQGSGQKDGTKLINEYREGGLVNLVFANNAVETGIHRIWTRLSTGTLKVFESCLPWFAEFRLYRRDEHGHVVKKDDHLMDGTRYAESKIELAIEEPDFDAINEYGAMNFNSDSQRSAVTGY